MKTRNIIDALAVGDLIKAKEETNDVLYQKAEHHLELARESVASTFGESRFLEEPETGVRATEKDDHQTQQDSLKKKHAKEKHQMNKSQETDAYNVAQGVASGSSSELDTSHKRERENMTKRHGSEREKLNKRQGGK